MLIIFIQVPTSASLYPGPGSLFCTVCCVCLPSNTPGSDEGVIRLLLSFITTRDVTISKCHGTIVHRYKVHSIYCCKKKETLIQMNGHEQASVWITDNDPFIWIRCVGAQKHLKHAGRVFPEDQGWKPLLERMMGTHGSLGIVVPTFCPEDLSFHTVMWPRWYWDI